jgi:hypothetical protein
MKNQFCSISTSLVLIWLVILAAGLGACSSTGLQGEAIDKFVADLQSAGATVEMRTKVKESFFPVDDQIIQVNGEEVRVFEFANSYDARKSAAQVSSDGYKVGDRLLDVNATPHFFNKDRLVVLYIGDNEAMLNLLSDQLGKQINQSDLPELTDRQEEAILEKLEDDLVNAGAYVMATGGKVRQSYFPVNAHYLVVNLHQVIIFIFPNEKKAAEAAKQISADGKMIGDQPVSFEEVPTFYKKGKLVVVLVGGDEDTFKSMKQVLGEPISKR